MTPATRDGKLEESFDGGELGPEEMDRLFDVLANSERRSTLRSLRDAGGAEQFDDLVADVARRTSTRPPNRTDRRSVATSLYHVHLPKLEAVGLVSESDPEGEVALSERVDDVPELLFESS